MQAATPIHQLDPSLCGFEMVVASTNNGAVENITRELPALSAIAQEYQSQAAYFPEVARAVLGQGDAWGLVAAVLGRKSKCQAFADNFWSKKEFAEPACQTLREVLRSSEGEDWQAVRAAFEQCRSTVVDLIEQRQHYEQVVQECSTLQAECQEAQEYLRQLQVSHHELRREERHTRAALEEAAHWMVNQEATCQQVEREKPPWWMRLIAFLWQTQRVGRYRTRQQEAQEALQQAQAEYQRRQATQTALATEVEQSQQTQQQAKRQLRQLQNQYKITEAELDQGRIQLGEALGNQAWWERPYEAVQRTAPWLNSELDNARSQLFLVALRVHQSFIQQAVSKVRTNIRHWVHLLANGYYPGCNETYARYVWQTAFLVIPVISTTFASAGRLFQPLGREDLGWLLIDEAGQAVPQAAVGALWRAKRAVVVGDPLQIEPVFTLDQALVEGLRHHFRLEDHWSPYSYSVQGLADRVNPFGTEVEESGELLWVGCPLRVHRRCLDPMFSLANAIAYEGKMVLATQTPAEDKVFPLGESRWIQVKGQCQGKHWVPQQGETVLQLMVQIMEQQAELPDVFVITPFRAVASRLKQLVRERWSAWAPALSRGAVHSWAGRSIGTVHTFQGKEAETVILVLGLDHSQAGAAQWAAQKPNLLNVAATRARYRFYIVGDLTLWGRQKHFEVAKALLWLESEGRNSCQVDQMI